ncbi:glutamate-rich protein 3 isoform X1 [Eleutherodactylus coqui]|uniref:glutamate-rich protein 3 isoform X1 n=1 Tax=Eleutherodactylus coqui TaxID=57060 RepID=UPI0034624A51
MSHPYIGPLSAYNSLTDKHLTGYFNNTRIRKHLQRAGLITRSGRILTEKEYRINAMRRDHQKYIRECLAQAIFQKVIDMERRHQIDIKRELETFTRKTRVQRLKGDPSKRAEDETLPALSPHPPTGPKSGSNRRPGNQDRSDSSESQASSLRPNTAPGNMQRPVRLQPLPVFSSSGNVPKIPTVSPPKPSAEEEEPRFTSMTDKEILRIMHTAHHSAGISPYRLPIINNFVMPVPPPPQKHPRQTVSTSTRGRRYHPTTATNEPDAPAKNTGKFHKTSLQSNVKIVMVYLGKNVHLSHDDSDYRDEIKVYQQHCGGENLCVYKGRLLEGEFFSLVSRRHRGFPFSLTFYINGIQADRLSSCCEYKQCKRVRLGGKNGYFGFINIEGASPCYRCIMGPAKKPSPPPKIKTKDKDGNNNKSSNGEVNGKLLSNADDDDDDEDKSPMDCQNKDDTRDEPEADDEAKDDYDERRNEEGQVDDEVSEKSKSPSDNEKDDFNQERRIGAPLNAAPEASDGKKDGKDGRYDSDFEEDKRDRKRRESFSSTSTVDSSSNDDGSEHDDDKERDGDYESESDKETETSLELDNHGKDLEVEEPEEADKKLTKTHLEERDIIVNENHHNVVGSLSNRREEDRKTECVNDSKTLGHMDEDGKSNAEEDLERKHSSDEEGGEYRP